MRPMDITYLGHACFLLRGRKAKVVTDPFGSDVGYKQSLAKPDVVTISHDHQDHSDLSRIEGEPMVIRGPGEYEICGVSITGIASFHDQQQGKERGQNTIYLIDIDEVRVCHLGDLGQDLTEKQLAQLVGIDVLLVPVGGKVSLGPKEALEVIKQLGPAIVIPMHFRTEGMTKDYDKLLPVKDFLELADGEKCRQEKKLSIKKLDLPEEMEIVLLERK
jgi:L-ascorbate metabolism protein UlaG (beta-lactamase superfamily)